MRGGEDDHHGCGHRIHGEHDEAEAVQHHGCELPVQDDLLIDGVLAHAARDESERMENELGIFRKH